MSDNVASILTDIGGSSAPTWGALKAEIQAVVDVATSNDIWLNKIAEREIFQSIGPNGALLPTTPIPHLSGTGTNTFTLAAHTVAAIPMVSSEYGGRAVIVETSSALTQGVSATGMHYVWLTRSITGVLSLTVTTVAGTAEDSVYLGKANVTEAGNVYTIGAISQPTAGRTRRRWIPEIGRWETYDTVTGEVLDQECIGRYKEDFYYLSLPWYGDVGGTAYCDSTYGGSHSVRCQLDATEEEQHVTLYQTGDPFPMDMSKAFIYQAVLAIGVLPTDLANACWGIGEGAVNADDSTTSKVALFQQRATGNLMVRTDDDTTDSGLVDTGITLVAEAKHVFKIDFTDMSNVRFYVDGTRVCAATTFDMSAAATSICNAFFNVYKASGAGVGALWVDRVCWWHD